jgi:hypothetical protein
VPEYVLTFTTAAVVEAAAIAAAVAGVSLRDIENDFERHDLAIKCPESLMFEKSSL